VVGRELVFTGNHNSPQTRNADQEVGFSSEIKGYKVKEVR